MGSIDWIRGNGNGNGNGNGGHKWEGNGNNSLEKIPVSRVNHILALSAGSLNIAISS